MNIRQKLEFVLNIFAANSFWSIFIDFYAIVFDIHAKNSRRTCAKQNLK